MSCCILISGSGWNAKAVEDNDCQITIPHDHWPIMSKVTEPFCTDNHSFAFFTAA